MSDVAVIERRQNFRFALETCEPIGVGDELLWQHLERDVALQARVVRAIDLAHAADAYKRSDLVRTEAGTRSDRHRDWRLPAADHTPSAQTTPQQDADKEAWALRNSAPLDAN